MNNVWDNENPDLVRSGFLFCLDWLTIVRSNRMSLLIISLVIFLATFTQSLTGFGVALVAMPLLTSLVDIRTATPMIALVGLTLEISLLFYYRRALQLRSIWRVVVASLPGIPIGLLILSRVDESITLTALGVVVAAYTLYALFQARLPTLTHPWWAYGAGFLAGMLGGAYNVSGPPIVIYGNCRGWQPAQFKSNLQSFFLLNSTLVVAGHAASQNLTPLVWQTYLGVLPALLLGVLMGISMDRFIAPAVFRKIILVLLLVVSVRLII